MNKKIEFNKVVVAMSVVIAFLLTAICVMQSFMGLDISSLVTLTGIVWAEVSVVTGTYSAKTKALNKIKLISSLPEEIRGQIDPNQLLN